MKRLLTLLFLFLPIMPVHATGSLYGVDSFGKPFSSARARDYIMLIESSMHYEFVALALASDNAFGGGQDANLMDAKTEAIRGCQRVSTRPDTCKIVDVNGESEFMKNWKYDISKPSFGNDLNLSDFQKKYKEWAKPAIDHGKDVALACHFSGGKRSVVTGENCYAQWGDSIPDVKHKVLYSCKQKYQQVCEIVDVNLQSLNNQPSNDSFTSKNEKPKPDSDYKLIGTGTGFTVNKYYVVTAEHVLEDCNAVSIRHGNQEIDAQTVARDVSNDLGLIRLQKPIGNTAKLRGGKRIRLGEMVVNYGYPLFGQLSTSATITEGNINNLSGAGNDSTVIQFDAPTQPGNSGGPLLDSSGNVVGVAIKILSKKYADATGHIAQNVNFAVKSNIVENFLQSNKIPFQTADSTEKLELPDIAEKAEAFTVLVGCWE